MARLSLINASAPDRNLIMAIKVAMQYFKNRTPLDINVLFQCTQGIQFFQELNQNDDQQKAHHQCCRHLTYKFVPKGQVFIKQGTEGNDFWITLRGQVKVFRYRKYDEDWISEFYHNESEFETSSRLAKANAQVLQEEVIKILGDGSSFGEKALLNHGNKRTMNIETLEASHFAILNKNNFDYILNEIKSHERQMQVSSFLNMNLMRQWNKDYVFDLFDMTREQDFIYNQDVYCQHSKQSDHLYFIKEGDFKIRVDNNSTLQFNKRDLVEETKHLTSKVINKRKQTLILPPTTTTTISPIKPEQLPTKRNKRLGYLKSHTDLTIMGQGEIFGDEDILYYLNDNPTTQRQRLFTVQCISLVGKVYLIDINDFLVFILKKNKLFEQWERATRYKVEHMQAMFASSKFQFQSQEPLVNVVSNFDYGEEKQLSPLPASRSLRKLKPESMPGYINQIYVSQAFISPKPTREYKKVLSNQSIQKTQVQYLKKKTNLIPSSSEFIHLTAAKYNLQYEQRIPQVKSPSLFVPSLNKLDETQRQSFQASIRRSQNFFSQRINPNLGSIEHSTSQANFHKQLKNRKSQLQMEGQSLQLPNDISSIKVPSLQNRTMQIFNRSNF